MRVLDPSITFEYKINGIEILRNIEKAGRTAYKTENAITNDSYIDFINLLMKLGHESVFEHQIVSIKIICDRGVSHEIVRHRIASYTQESTRYCNYSKEKFGNEISVIKPMFFSKETNNYKIWYQCMQIIEKSYLEMIKNGAKPEEARTILPNSLKTEIVVTMNIREWRYFLKLRTAKNAHPQMQQIAKMILKEFKENVPIIFDDIEV